ncbi:MAG: hypothetical protein QNJ13_10410 [Paracoccaceae bacterium]|nr:hypothetical protein [Paracoccaceae bacterium]
MSMSFADGFRTLQAVRDLRVLAALAPVEAWARIAAGIPDGWMAPIEAQAALMALAEGREIDPDIREETMSAVRLAAALPKEDFAAFLTATMILLAETLERGEGVDDVYWLWQTFRGDYRVAAAIERAAIVQAIRRIGLLRGDTMALPETAPDRSTAPAAALRPLLERLRPKGLAPPDANGSGDLARLLLEALSSAEAAEETARRWQTHGADLARSAAPEVLAGFRHLYETRDGWAPTTEVTIPLLDPPPGFDWPR